MPDGAPSRQRPRGTRPDPRARAVIAPDGTIYQSVTFAAVATRTAPSTISYRLIAPNSGWRYLDEAPVDPAGSPTAAG